MQLNPRPLVIIIITLVCGVVAAILLIGPVFYTSQWAIKNYVRTHPDDVAIACFDPRAPAEGFYHNADDEYPLASTFKIVLLTAYAQEVAAGRLDEQESIPVSALEAYYLPGTDGGAHPEFLKSLGEGRQTLTLDEVVEGMVVYSSNAATDYLQARLQNVDYAELYQRLGLEQVSQPISILGLYLALNNHEQGPAKVGSYNLEAALAAINKYEQAFLNDPAWRQAELEYVIKANNSAPLNVQKWFLGMYGMSGSARDLAKILQAAYGYNDALSLRAQAIMRQHLEWPLRVYPDNAKDFKILATKGGAWPAILTSAWYAESPKGEPRVLVVLYANLRDDYWNTWLSNYSHQAFEASVLKNADCAVFSELFK
ncbi:MAG: serine hydrolase [Anaerolineales bacterium]